MLTLCGAVALGQPRLSDLQIKSGHAAQMCKRSRGYTRLCLYNEFELLVVFHCHFEAAANVT